MLQTYLPHKYKVHFGTKANIGLVTCWSDPEVILHQSSEILNHVSILSTLYSREGVSIIIRNLALNPQIRYLLIWTNSPLSQTEIGKSGLDLLKKLFTDGINSDGTVMGTNTKLHPEIAPEIIQKIISNVEFIDLSDLSYEQLLTKLSVTNFSNLEKFMEPISFPESNRDTSVTWPSEKVGWLVRDQKIVNVWLKVVDKILRYGSVRETDYGNNQKELQYVTWVVENEDIDDLYLPDWPDNILEACGFSSHKLNQYKNSLLDPVLPAQTSYTYGYRLRNYLDQIDQIQEIIRLLNESLVTRRAFATTFIPTQDFLHSSPPCLTSIQVLSDNQQKINLFVNIRSNDIFKAALSNAVGLLNLQKYISDQVGLLPGKMTITSVSAHIYEEDWDMAQKLIDCQLISKSNLIFDEKNDLDPRGVVRIFLSNNQICLELSNMGEVLYEIQAHDAQTISRKIAHLDLLSRADHYIDIGIELAKAEYCLKNNMTYKQDRNLL